MAQALLAGADVICWENIILHSHPEIEISFKFIPKILMSKECIHFFGPLCVDSLSASFYSSDMVKVKQPRYRPGVAQRVPGS